MCRRQEVYKSVHFHKEKVQLPITNRSFNFWQDLSVLIVSAMYWVVLLVVGFSKKWNLNTYYVTNLHFASVGALGFKMKPFLSKTKTVRQNRRGNWISYPKYHFKSLKIKENTNSFDPKKRLSSIKKLFQATWSKSQQKFNCVSINVSNQGAHQMEPASPIQALGVNPFPSRFINRTIPWGGFARW